MGIRLRHVLCTRSTCSGLIGSSLPDPVRKSRANGLRPASLCAPRETALRWGARVFHRITLWHIHVMREPQPKTIQLKDYTPPPFLIDSVDLDIDIRADD